MLDLVAESFLSASLLLVLVVHACTEAVRWRRWTGWSVEEEEKALSLSTTPFSLIPGLSPIDARLTFLRRLIDRGAATLPCNGMQRLMICIAYSSLDLGTGHGILNRFVTILRHNPPETARLLQRLYHPLVSEPSRQLGINHLAPFSALLGSQFS